MYLMFYSLARFFIEGLRIDSLMLGNYRISQILSVSILFYFLKKKNKITQKPASSRKHAKNVEKNSFKME